MRSNITNYMAIGQALLAAVLFGMSAPVSKLLLIKIPPLMLPALLYLGAGFGMLLFDLARRMMKFERTEAKLEKNELPFVFLMIVLDIIAPILLILGLNRTTASSVSLLNNFEMVATSVIALLVFKEAIGRRLWLSVSLITLASIMLSVKDFSSFTFSIGSIFVLLACVSWGLENNCTRKLSIKDPLQVVVIKGLASGTGALIIAVSAGETVWNTEYILFSLLLGCFAYGLSIFFYVNAQRHLGAARTSAYFAVAPFVGVGIAFIVLSEPITLSFIIALVTMLVGTYLAVFERHEHEHEHLPVEHEHRHSHTDGHHDHFHEIPIDADHTHLHTHRKIVHKHLHTPDLHHNHKH